MVTPQKILVTGSTRGVGHGIAKALLKEGYSVVLHGRKPTDQSISLIKELRSHYDSLVDGIFFDVGNYEEAASALSHHMEVAGAFYGIVCNAGGTDDVTFPAMSIEQWRKVLSENLDSFYHVLHPLVLPMIKMRQGGRIVVISSLSGVIGNRGQVHYSAAKAGLIGATKALARDLASRGITVNCIAPGPVETDMLSGELLQQLIKNIPLERACAIHEVAHVVKSLLHADAGYITGQTVVLAGGLV